MKLHMTRRDGSIDPTMEYGVEERFFIVLSGSKISETETEDKTSSSANSVEKARLNGLVENGILTEDVRFKSASSVANLVTGTSTKGEMAWKDDNDNSLKEIQSRES